MQTSFTIRQVDNRYCDQIIDLILPIQQIEFNVPITIEGQPDLLDIEINYFKEGGSFLGAFKGEELVGTIALINMGHNAGAIRKMFVKKEFRGKEFGIAQQLLEILIQYSRDKQITDLYLGTVEQLKAAHRFYERNGFILTDIKDFPAYFPRMMADNIFYRLHLN